MFVHLYITLLYILYIYKNRSTYIKMIVDQWFSIQHKAWSTLVNCLLLVNTTCFLVCRYKINSTDKYCKYCENFSQLIY